MLGAGGEPAREGIVAINLRLICCVLLSVALAPVEAPAAPTVVNCTPAKVVGVVSSKTTSTQSTNFVNIVESGLNFTQGGAAASCVIVRFSAEALSGGGANDILFVRAVLDNLVLALPDIARYAASESVFRARSFEFVLPMWRPAHTRFICNSAAAAAAWPFSGRAR